MKLNCDLGESFGVWAMGDDALVMPYLDMANIACGFHASDPVVMDTTVQLAIKHQVEIGAHPGYPDLAGFGRRSLNCSENEIRTLLIYQIGALSAFAKTYGRTVSYVKPHGALYNDMMSNDEVFQSILKAIADLPEKMSLVVQATVNNDQYLEQADKLGVQLIFEAFADRAYDDSGLLLSRSLPGAVIKSSEEILGRVRQLVSTGTLNSISGNLLKLSPDTLCVHGDNPESVKMITNIKKVIDDN